MPNGEYAQRAVGLAEARTERREEQQVTVAVRPYRGTDETDLLRVWNEAMAQDPVSPEVFRRKVILDPNFSAERLLVAEREGRLAGFVLLLRRRVPFEGIGLEPERAWITAFGVAPEARRQGIGTALFDAAERAAAGARTIAIAPYVPNYFVPGVDEAAYPEAIAFLEARGYVRVSRAMSMDAPLAVWSWPEGERERAAALTERGIVVEPLSPSRLPEFLTFLSETMPPDWLRHAREILIGTTDGRCGWDQVLIAREGDTIVGYSQFEGDHFGPFGVRETHRGRGIGAALLGRTLEQMRRRGSHCAWLLWTDERAGRLYQRFGFRPSRRFVLLRKELP